jgi:hypothetical protein
LLEAIRAEIAAQTAAEEQDPARLAALSRHLYEERRRTAAPARHAA